MVTGTILKQEGEGESWGRKGEGLKQGTGASFVHALALQREYKHCVLKYALRK